MRNSGAHYTEEAPAQTLFSQQRLEAWRPLFTPFIIIIITFIGGLIFLIFGIIFYYFSKSLVKIDQRYDDICNGIDQCLITIDVPKKLTGNIFLHYKLTNFFQNHRRYIYSRSDAQLRGEFLTYNELSSCGDYRSVNGSHEVKDLLVPCGATALSFFNDTFNWMNDTGNNQFSDAGISWRSDREKLFKPPNEKYNESVQWLNESHVEGNIRSERFITWMRTSTLPTFIKIAQRCIKCSIDPGKYMIHISNNYPTSNFNGEKHIILSTVNIMGGKNDDIGLAYIITGSIFILYSIVVMISHLCFPRKLGDASYFMGDF